MAGFLPSFYFGAGVHGIPPDNGMSIVVFWAALISGYAQNGRDDEALLSFYEMYLLGVKAQSVHFLFSNWRSKM